MEKQGFIHSLPFKLLVALAVGICLGLALSGMDNGVSHAILNIVVTVKYIAAQFISFCVPLIIIGFIAPSITRLGNNASRMLIVALFIAYVSSIGAAFFATFSGYTILPHLNINPDVDGLKELPEVVFQLSIPQIMPVMSALFFSVLVGLAAAWNNSKIITQALEEFQNIVLSIVTKFVIPVLPLLIGTTSFNRYYLLHLGLRRNHYQAVTHLLNHHHYRNDRTLHLADSSLLHCRSVFQEESHEHCKALWSCIYDSSRNHVFRSNPFRSFGVCKKVRAYYPGRYGGLRNPSFCQHSPLRLRYDRDLLRYGGIQDALQ